MAKFTLGSIQGGFAGIQLLNDNFATLQAELQSKVLYRNNPEGEDNAMENLLDMNSNRIINLPDAIADSEPVTLGQLNLGTSDSQSAIDAGFSAAAAAADLIAFEQNYLGQFATPPLLDNEGNAILEGALYYDTTANAMFVRDGSGNWVAFAIIENGWKPIIAMYFSASPLTDETVLQFVAPQNHVIPAGATDSQAFAGTVSTASTVFTIHKNGGSSLGTVTFATATAVGTFSIASPISLVAGDRLTIVAPTSPDATLADISITFRTEQVVGALLSAYAANNYVDSGAVNAHILSAVGLTVAPPLLEDGLAIEWKPNITNTGAITINVAGLGAVPLHDTNGDAFVGGEIIAGVFTSARFDFANSRFFVVTPFQSPASISQQWPIGAVFTATVSTNPATLLGFGTWSEFAEGRVLIGEGTGNDGTEARVFAPAETGGKYKHSLTAAENGAHTHATGMLEDGGNSASLPERGSGSASGSFTSGSSGSGDGHNNVQPYITVFMWERTA